MHDDEGERGGGVEGVRTQSKRGILGIGKYSGL